MEPWPKTVPSGLGLSIPMAALTSQPGCGWRGIASVHDVAPPFPCSFQEGSVPHLLGREAGQTPAKKCTCQRELSQQPLFCFPLALAFTGLM